MSYLLNFAIWLARLTPNGKEAYLCPKKFIFDGVSSLDMHLVIEHAPRYTAATKSIDYVDVEGNRNFVSYSPLTGFDKYTAEYQVAYIPSDPARYYTELREISLWLLGLSGRDNGSRIYKPKLTDDYEPDVYRYATYEGPLNISNFLRKGGRGTLSFSVSPRRYFFSGDEPVSVTLNARDQTLFQNQYMPVGPLIEITKTTDDGKDVIIWHRLAASGSGQYPTTITVQNWGAGKIVVDCERMLAYKPDTNELIK